MPLSKSNSLTPSVSFAFKWHRNFRIICQSWLLSYALKPRQALMLTNNFKTYSLSRLQGNLHGLFLGEFGHVAVPMLTQLSGAQFRYHAEEFIFFIISSAKPRSSTGKSKIAFLSLCTTALVTTSPMVILTSNSSND